MPDNLKNNPTAVQLFLREARAAAALSHPNIVTLFDADQEADGSYYLTMELLEGFGLDSAAEETRPALRARHAARIGVQIAKGLQFAHEKGIVHRDIKTANLFFTRDRVVKIMDFGLAKMTEEVRRSAHRDRRDALLHGARAGGGREGGPSRRSVCLRRHAVRAGDRRRALPRRATSPTSIATRPRPIRAAASPDCPSALAELILRLMAKAPDAAPGHAPPKSCAQLEKLLAEQAAPAVRASAATAKPERSQASCALRAAIRTPACESWNVLLDSPSRWEPGETHARRRTRRDESDGEEIPTGFGVNAGIVEEIRQRWELDPRVGARELVGGVRGEERRSPRPRAEPAAKPHPGALASPQLAEKYARVLRLIHAYRARGHRIADTDPLGARADYFPELDPAHYGLGNEDFDTPFFAGDLPGGPIQPLRQILERLRATYCRKVGVEFTHIQDPGPRQWLMRRMEESENTTLPPHEERLRILEKLSAAELFERFLHTKFVGQKRFGLEGAEALIPLLDTIVEESPGHGVRELVIGMAHRGRLNVLSNIVGKSLESIFSEFEDIELEEAPFGSGDVKYHKGFTSDRQHAHRRERPPLAHRESLASRGGGPGGRGPRPRQADARRRHAARTRSCRCCCTATPPSPARAWWPRC